MYFYAGSLIKTFSDLNRKQPIFYADILCWINFVCVVYCLSLMCAGKACVMQLTYALNWPQQGDVQLTRHDRANVKKFEVVQLLQHAF